MEKGKCHACQKWIPIESIKTADVRVSVHELCDINATYCVGVGLKIPELYWYDHMLLKRPKLKADGLSLGGNTLRRATARITLLETKTLISRTAYTCGFENMKHQIAGIPS